MSAVEFNPASRERLPAALTRHADTRLQQHGLPRAVIEWPVTLVAGVVVALFIAGCTNDDERQRQTDLAYRAELRAQVEEIAQRWRANDDWESKLVSSDGDRWSEVMSVELQHLWSGNRILFVGTLEDIFQLPDGSYQVTATHDGLVSSRTLIDGIFGLRVTCPAQIGEGLLAAYVKIDSDRHWQVSRSTLFRAGPHLG